MKAYLQRVNPENGAVWYYAIQIQPDLFDRWHIIREWGRSGSPGTVRRSPYETYQEAVDALIQLRDELTKKGYRVVMQEGLNKRMVGRVKKEPLDDDYS
uniref:WGR domain-containing protein n=1 Tax=Magnetococcus massalia (strain MO-1) TaxID=451514 RepID=A0A1S7LPS2_MAGMO|nr:conserved protein of unknown function with WGR domain [Candidatus Magnetococcus massalia]